MHVLVLEITFYQDSLEIKAKLHSNQVSCSLSYTIIMYLSRKGFWFWLHLRFWLWFWFRFWLTPLYLRGWFSSWWPCLRWRGWRACPFLEFGFLILSLTNEGFCFLKICRPTSYIMSQVGDVKTSVDCFSFLV